MTIIRQLDTSTFGITADAVVCPCNCQGVPDTITERLFRSRHPRETKLHLIQAQQGLTQIGRVHTTVSRHLSAMDPRKNRYLIFLPTRQNPGNRVYPEYIQAGMDSLRQEVQHLDLRTIAVPALGCEDPHLPWEQAREIITRTLQDLDLRVILIPPRRTPGRRRQPPRNPGPHDRELPGHPTVGTPPGQTGRTGQ